MEGEDGTSAAAPDGGATRVVGATGRTLDGVEPEATTERPNDLRRSTNWIAVMPSMVVLSKTGVLAFSACDAWRLPGVADFLAFSA